MQMSELKGTLEAPLEFCRGAGWGGGGRCGDREGLSWRGLGPAFSLPPHPTAGQASSQPLICSLRGGRRVPPLGSQVGGEVRPGRKWPRALQSSTVPPHLSAGSQRFPS